MAYKPKSTSYLMKMTKKEIIAELRAAENNGREMLEDKDNQITELRKLLKAAVEDLHKFIQKIVPNGKCKRWRFEAEALKALGEAAESKEA